MSMSMNERMNEFLLGDKFFSQEVLSFLMPVSYKSSVWRTMLDPNPAPTPSPPLPQTQEKLHTFPPALP